MTESMAPNIVNHHGLTTGHAPQFVGSERQAVIRRGDNVVTQYSRTMLKR